jgi:hypothetical protein
MRAWSAPVVAVRQICWGLENRSKIGVDIESGFNYSLFIGRRLGRTGTGRETMTLSQNSIYTVKGSEWTLVSLNRKNGKLASAYFVKTSDMDSRSNLGPFDCLCLTPSMMRELLAAGHLRSEA